MTRKLRVDLIRARRAADANGGAAIQSPLRDSPSFLVRMAQLSAFDEFHRHFAGLNMTPARFSVFVLIVYNPGVRPGALTEELRVKPSNIATLEDDVVLSPVDIVDHRRRLESARGGFHRQARSVRDLDVHWLGRLLAKRLASALR